MPAYTQNTPMNSGAKAKNRVPSSTYVVAPAPISAANLGSIQTIKGKAVEDAALAAVRAQRQIEDAQRALVAGVRSANRSFVDGTNVGRYQAAARNAALSPAAMYALNRNVGGARATAVAGLQNQAANSIAAAQEASTQANLQKLAELARAALMEAALRGDSSYFLN